MRSPSLSDSCARAEPGPSPGKPLWWQAATSRSDRWSPDAVRPSPPNGACTGFWACVETEAAKCLTDGCLTVAGDLSHRGLTCGVGSASARVRIDEGVGMVRVVQQVPQVLRRPRIITGLALRIVGGTVS